MKIFINNPQENWVVDRFVEEWISYNKHLHTNDIKEADLLCEIKDKELTSYPGITKKVISKVYPDWELI